MKKEDIKNKSKEELGKFVNEKQEALRTFRFNLSGSKIKNVREGRKLRRDVARAKTAIQNAK